MLLGRALVDTVVGGARPTTILSLLDALVTLPHTNTSAYATSLGTVCPMKHDSPFRSDLTTAPKPTVTGSLGCTSYRDTVSAATRAVVTVEGMSVLSVQAIGLAQDARP